MNGPRLGSLFTGSGMLDEGVRAVLGGSVAWHAEIDPAASKVLAYRYPDVPNLGDLTAVDWTGVEPVDVLTGGFPCQDVSHAGKRAGMRAGTRSGLWARMCDAIDQLRPALVVAENVRGLLSAEADSALEPCPGCVGDDGDGAVLRALGRVLGDLADLGYDASWYGLRAADVGAPHGRFRVFIIARVADAELRRAWKDDPRGRNVVGQGGVQGGWDEGAGSYRPDSPAAADASGGSLARAAATRDGLRLTAERRDRPAPDADRDTLRLESVAESGSSRPPIAGHAGPDAPTNAQGWQFPDEPSRSDVGLSSVGSVSRAGDRDHAGHHAARDSELGRGAAVVAAPADSDSDGRQGVGRLDPLGRDADGCGSPDIAWGQYEPAIRRWEQRLGRIAPAPTETGAKGGQRLSPEFVTWMMGWPPGWVTGVPGISRNDALRICGNGIVPQQAAEALRRLLGATAVAA